MEMKWRAAHKELGQGLALALMAVGGACAATPRAQLETRPTVTQSSPSASAMASHPESVASPDSDCTRVLWCASGGAALVGEPVLDVHERVYAATSDGYLHAFERDGRFRFSYTVEGTPLGSVSLRPLDGAILLGTSAAAVYAINQNGSLHFRHRTPTAVWSGLYALNERSVTFLGLDGRLYALSNSGQALYRVRAPSAPTTEPAVAENDVVWVGLDGAVARFVSAYRLERIALVGSSDTAGPVEQIVPFGRGAVARAGSRGYWIVSGQPPLDLGPLQQLGSDGVYLALAVGSGLRLVQLKEAGSSAGQPGPFVDVGRYDLAGKLPSDAIAIAGRRVLVPHADGTVTLFSEHQKCEGQISEVGLRRPVWGHSGRFFVVADQAGQFCAVEARSSQD